MLLTAVLALLHILAAMLWLGGGAIFGLVIGPRLRRLALPSSGEFLAKVGPAIVSFFRATPAATILFGFLLLYNMTNGNLGQLSPSTSWGFDMTAGMSVALVAFVISEAGTVPATSKVVRMLQRMQTSGYETVPPELPKAIRLAFVSANLTFVLLLITLGFMVAAGFY